MLHLAQVTPHGNPEQPAFLILASQTSESLWEVKEPVFLPMEAEHPWPVGMLLLLESDDRQQIISVTDATNWVLGMVQQYLTEEAITPEFIQKEQTKIEQWRQEITAKSQDLTKRQLEIETRREELQQLESSLKEEQQE